MSIYDEWNQIKYVQGDKKQYRKCDVRHETCVLASFAIAAYPFVKIDILEYFKAYCLYRKLKLDDDECPQCEYSKDLKKFERDIKSKPSNGLPENLGGGYCVIWDLYSKSSGDVFERCRKAFSLEVIDLKNENDDFNRFSRLKDKLMEGSTAMLFVNEPNTVFETKYLLGRSHSIAVAYSVENKFFYRDPNFREVRYICSLSKFNENGGNVGDCLLLTKK